MGRPKKHMGGLCPPRRKVLEAVASSKKHHIEGTVEVGETAIGQQEEGSRGRKNTN